MRKAIKKYVIIVLAVISVFFIFRRMNILPSFKNIFKSQPITIDETPIILQKINILAQLLTITYTDEVVMDTSKIGSGLPSLVPSNVGAVLMPAVDRLVIIGRGEVIAGTDLKNLSEKDISVTGDSVHIILPRATILQTIINPTGFETYDEKGKWSEQEVTQLKLKIRNEITQRALRENILDQANQRCVEIIRTLIANSGFKKINIELKN